MYLKNANKRVFTGIAPTITDRNDHNRPEAYIVYYLCGAVVYGCTTPLIHLTKEAGCLSEKFFIFYFWRFIRLHILFQKIFLKFFSIQVYLFSLKNFFQNFLFFFLQMMAGMCIFVVHQKLIFALSYQLLLIAISSFSLFAVKSRGIFLKKDEKSFGKLRKVCIFALEEMNQ